MGAETEVSYVAIASKALRASRCREIVVPTVRCPLSDEEMETLSSTFDLSSVTLSNVIVKYREV